MYLDSHTYTTTGEIHISRFVLETSIDTAIQDSLSCLDSQYGSVKIPPPTATPDKLGVNSRKNKPFLRGVEGIFESQIY